jgi:LysR family nitrogen assimilation transcriptional regulator
MELDQLRHFVQVAESGSFSRAAETLGVKQPYLSRRVGALETELRRHLFHRHGRGIKLTEAGQRFLTVAVSVLQQLELAAQHEADADEELSGKIVIGLPPSTGCFLSVPLVQGFIERFPNARISIVEELSSALPRSLLSRRVDIAFLHNWSANPQLTTSVVADDPLCLISRRDRAQGDNLRLAELGGMPLILPCAPHPVRTMLEVLAAQQGVAVDVAYEVDGVEAILQLVESGIASTISSSTLVRRGRYAETLKARKLIDPDMPRILNLATVTMRPQTALMQRTMALAQQVSAREFGPAYRGESEAAI